MNVLRLGRHRRPEPQVPTGCRCIIRHPADAADRRRISEQWQIAVLTDQMDLAGQLLLRLTTNCVRGQVMCQCGCGRPLHQHVEMKAAA